MPSIADSINSIKDQLRDQDFARQSHEQTQREHERILDEYDRMTRKRSTRIREERDGSRKSGGERRRSRSPSSMRFRFKDGKGSDGRKRKSKSKSRHRSHRHSHRHGHTGPEDQESNARKHTASTSPLHDSNKATSPKDTDTAFRESLFDAMADDEGAAYWQAIYGDSIHSYPRPTIQTPHGHLEEMSDDQYVCYVKTKMWEKKNPELLREKLSREEQGERAKRRHGGEEHDDDEYEEDFEWVGNAEKGYEKRSTRSRRIPRPQETRESRHDAAFVSDVDAALARGAARKQSKRYHSAWFAYLQRWAALKSSPPSTSSEALLKEIPWPVQSLVSTDVNKQNVQDFFTNAPLDDQARIKTLKDQSVNWHPDRFQRRFGGGDVDEETLKLATSVFQTIYDMWERMRPAK
ncbi:hypothetical protein AUEXF2481DRAFT_39904 [Aureobasidium subglaciale EXF-2481]|uniref:J domain-containing protein n=1 Tax=Aureobasidium subglaciale (strain EXF-2481) TaxID=1043005 RepID=A0A074YC22_AURSE|nr:uncharacterized protein AUEXF2481DRAFT_39904 [Aureobasidium subglaciale EXF-2481]KAI5204978.1 hypothetical protein E4T38_04537 [Aureobasidium subglaciale]KAI5223891.1 hypothetical protein E4T40_04313 [Aureobasidium subglaciale]KAI5227439.1 hypothetical protein E4T41_04395 [Aureobasidium subglaciale]KAI5262782.1 hypothetical protein E4T46_04281 [Aureobasidium subglaciale]KEQ95348.1 hypothetical protein AUEXF2481DRAFT_39904 [Aureobasidium subglaciale EXF-2481]